MSVPLRLLGRALSSSAASHTRQLPSVHSLLRHSARTMPLKTGGTRLAMRGHVETSRLASNDSFEHESKHATHETNAVPPAESSTFSSSVMPAGALGPEPPNDLGLVPVKELLTPIIAASAASPSLPQASSSTATPPATGRVVVIKGPPLPSSMPPPPAPIPPLSDTEAAAAASNDSSASSSSSSADVAAKVAALSPPLNEDGWPINPETRAPLEPEPWQCCGNDCVNCVWIQYDEQVTKYKDEQRKKAKDVAT